MSKKLNGGVAAGVIGVALLLVAAIAYFQFAGGRQGRPEMADPRVNQMYSPPPGSKIIPKTSGG